MSVNLKNEEFLKYQNVYSQGISDKENLKTSLSQLKKGIKKEIAYYSSPVNHSSSSITSKLTIDIFKLHFDKYNLKIDVLTDDEIAGVDFYCFNPKEKKSALIIVKKFIEIFFRDRFETIDIKNGQVHVRWKKVEIPSIRRMDYDTTISNYEKQYKKPESDLEFLFFLDENPGAVYNGETLKGYLKTLENKILAANFFTKELSFDMFKLHFDNGCLKIEVFPDLKKPDDEPFCCFNAGKKEGALQIVKKYLEIFLKDKIAVTDIKDECIHVQWK